MFAYLDAFDHDKPNVLALKEHYSRGGLGDVKIKRYLLDVLESILEPIRKKREQFASDPAQVMKIIQRGTDIARERAAKTMSQVRNAMKINYF